MDGFWKRIYQLIFLCLSLCGLSSVQAQDIGNRIERAFINSQSLIVQVSVPRGRTVDTAHLTMGGQRVTLNAAPVPSELSLWIILDRSESVINAAPSIQTSVNRFINGFSADTQIGAILYHDETALYLPSTNRTEISTWLSGYSGLVNSPNCIGTVLSTLADQITDNSRVHRVLVVSGGLVRQGACDDAIPSLAIPVDFVIVSDSVDPLYEDLQIRFGGRLLRANLRTISNRLDEIKSLWSNPVYELSGTYSGEATTGEVELALSDGTSLRLPVEFEVIAQVEVAQPTLGSLNSLGNMTTQPPEDVQQIPTESDTVIPTLIPDAPTTIVPTANQIAAVATSTIANVGVVSPSDTQVPAATSPTQAEVMPTIVQPTELVATESIPTTVSQAEATATESLPATDSQIAFAPTEIVPTTATELDGLTTNPTIPSIDSQTDMVALLTQPMVLGGGIFLILGLLILTGFRRKPKKANAAAQYNPNEKTMLDAPENTQIEWDAFSSNNQLEITEMVEESDLFEVTEIVTEEDLRAGNKPAVVALLKDDNKQLTYEIRRPDTVLGRLDSCQIVITDASISREHLRFIVTEKDEIEVVVLTKNPVLLNDIRMENRAKLKIGDAIQVSPNTRLTVIQATQV